jgi:hypothetical protein
LSDENNIKINTSPDQVVPTVSDQGTPPSSPEEKNTATTKEKIPFMFQGPEYNPWSTQSLSSIWDITCVSPNVWSRKFPDTIPKPRKESPMANPVLECEEQKDESATPVQMDTPSRPNTPVHLDTPVRPTLPVNPAPTNSLSLYDRFYKERFTPYEAPKTPSKYTPSREVILELKRVKGRLNSERDIKAYYRHRIDGRIHHLRVNQAARSSQQKQAMYNSARTRETLDLVRRMYNIWQQQITSFNRTYYSLLDSLVYEDPASANPQLQQHLTFLHEVQKALCTVPPQLYTNPHPIVPDFGCQTNIQ